MATPKKTTTTTTTTPRHARSKSTSSSEIFKVSENSDPNIPISSPPPSQKPFKSPSTAKSAKSNAKSAPRNPARAILAPPPPPPGERKFIIAKKKKKGSNGGGGNGFDIEKCRREAYEALRASQEGFFKKDPPPVEEPEMCSAKCLTEKSEEEESGTRDLEGSSNVRKMRSLVMEEAMSSIPDPGSGRVKHLVQAFESLLSVSDEKEKEADNRKIKTMNWALPGLGQRIKAMENGLDSVSVTSSAEFFTSKDFERDSRGYSSMDSNYDRLSKGSRTSSGGRRSRRNSLESLRRSWNKKLKVTSQHPFKLRTEQRGRLKEEQFLKKVKEMLWEEEKKRIPIAQGLPWTTDEPECLVKPPIKESTEPIDLVLHSEVRAVERSEFDHYVAERLSFAEQLRLERERQQKLEEEEEIRRLRKELVPKAQPMPYFDRPFVPKKSARPRTVPKEPRFHLRTVKSSW
ncbi:Protein TPX2 [Ananas comosus]|uniref:Protein TPX2 n=1 Tax=Ananas comosus TaxID=4615 RepID=A0A199VZ43_ANACO|nr:Protein TPX2 [Ananas comosus]